MINEKEAFYSKMQIFLDAYGANQDCLNELLDYVNKKVGPASYYYDKWIINKDSIELCYSWASHSFFDDGGGVRGMEKWSLTYVGDSSMEYTIENEKINDKEQYFVSAFEPEVNDLFYALNPFGFKGVFQIKFYGNEEHTD